MVGSIWTSSCMNTPSMPGRIEIQHTGHPMPFMHPSNAPPIHCTKMPTVRVWAHSKAMSACRLPNLFVPRTKASFRLPGGVPQSLEKCRLPHTAACRTILDTHYQSGLHGARHLAASATSSRATIEQHFTTDMCDQQGGWVHIPRGMTKQVYCSTPFSCSPSLEPVRDCSSYL